jgi:hypothetical protein
LGEAVFFFVSAAFVAWVVYFGGAEWLEGTLVSAIVIDSSAPLWTAAGIKLYTLIAWIGGWLLWLLVR